MSKRTILQGTAIVISVLLASSCSFTTSASKESDVSSDIAAMAVNLNQNQTTTVQSSMVDESTAANESATTVARDLGAGASRGATANNITITVVHSNAVSIPKPTPFQNGDVVQVTRSWTNAQGEAISDTVVRPHIPAAVSDYSASVTYTPNAGTSGLSTANVSATYDSSAVAWTITGTDTKTVNSITTSQQVFSMTYHYNGTRFALTRISKSGEAVSGFPTTVKLTSTLWYRYNGTTDVEFLRVLDYVNASSTLKRQVYAWSVAPPVSSIALWDSTLAKGSTTATALTFTPVLAAETGASTVDFWYFSDPSIAIGSLNPVYGTLSSYPKLDISKWTGSVLQEYGPRIADWYKPIASTGTFIGNYTRRNTITTYLATGASSTAVYSLSDGVSPLTTVSSETYRTAANGTLKTTKVFSDNVTSTVTITPTTDANGNITGYTIVRDGTTDML